MTIAVQCVCGQGLKLPPDALGHAGSCPACRRRLHLVSADFEPTRDHFRHVLIVESGPALVGEVFLLGGAGAVEIGKRPDKAIHLPGEKVSRTHCRLVPAADGWRIEDQRSTNGTRVDGRPAANIDLHDNSTIGIGEYTLRFRNLSSLLAAAPARVTSVPANVPSAAAASIPAPARPADDLYVLVEDEEERQEEPAPITVAEKVPIETGPPQHCPSCGKELPHTARICIDCGVHLETGRAILIADEANVDTIRAGARHLVWWFSWLVPFWFFPVASEGLGWRKPWATRGIAVLTIIVSVWFWRGDIAELRSRKELMLWGGQRQPTAQELEEAYLFGLGDEKAFDSARKELAKGKRIHRLPQSQRDALTLKAHASLAPEQQPFGHFRIGQLVSHAFLHSGYVHLAGNLLLLLVLGSRVNAIIGNPATVIAYLLLAMVAGAAHMLSVRGESPVPMIGASGAVMGMAGMYLILLPVHKMHVIVWLRLIVMVFRKFFIVRGFWVLLVFVALDVLAMALQSEDDVAHWAHVGGFAGGVVLGLLLLVTRAVNCRGGDILSGLLGRRAWPLIGRPDSSRRSAIAWC